MAPSAMRTGNAYIFVPAIRSSNTNTEFNRSALPFGVFSVLRTYELLKTMHTCVP